MARKTNKTSHVLNLITNGAPPEPEEKAPEVQAPEETASGKGAGTPDAGKGQEPAALQNQAGDRKVIVVDASENDKISDAIRERLEEQVEREAGNGNTPAPEAVPAAAATAGGEGDAPKDAADSRMPEAADMMTNPEVNPEAAAEAAGTATEPGAAPQAADVTGTATEPEAASQAAGSEASAVAEESKNKDSSRTRRYHMVNVMEEVIGRYDLLGQMGKYGVCTCSRCFADVQALTLTHLPAKYVVVDGNPIAPIIGYYESKYRSRILTEVMKACILVKDKPRHNRDNVTPELLD
jgi:hypothetical protein